MNIEKKPDSYTYLYFFSIYLPCRVLLHPRLTPDEKTLGRGAAKTHHLRLQNRPRGRKLNAMGPDIPPLRNRVTSPMGMAEGNGKNGENPMQYLASRITDPVRPKTKQERTKVVR